VKWNSDRILLGDCEKKTWLPSLSGGDEFCGLLFTQERREVW